MAADGVSGSPSSGPEADLAPGADSPRCVTDKLPVSRETLERLGIMRSLLVKWQAKTNLVARGTLEAFWRRHVLDSLQVLPLAGQARFWVDLGSGGGFPGMAIAIAQADKGDRRHVLVESNAKKCAFLREVARQTDARAEIRNERIEQVVDRLAAAGDLPDIVTARALAPLPRLLMWSAPLLAQGGRAIFHKGRDFQKELDDCHGLWRFDLVKHASLVEADSVLLEILNPVRC